MATYIYSHGDEYVSVNVGRCDEHTLVGVGSTPETAQHAEEQTALQGGGPEPEERAIDWAMMSAWIEGDRPQYLQCLDE